MDSMGHVGPLFKDRLDRHGTAIDGRNELLESLCVLAQQCRVVFFIGEDGFVGINVQGQALCSPTQSGH